jgi:hypothetical protein
MKKITTIILAVLFTANLMAQVPNYVPTNGLDGWYSFTGNANDESGNGNNGVVNGATLTIGKQGVSNTAYTFNGISNTINFPNPFLGGAQISAFTFHALIYLNSNNKDLMIWSKTLFWGEIGFNITNLNGIRFGWANSVSGNKYSTIYSQTNVIQANQWYDIVVTFNNSVGQIYLNGDSIMTNLIWTAQGGSVISTSQIEASCNFAQDINSSKIGNYLNNYFFDGNIDNIGIWNRALNQQEITNLYNSCKKDISISPQISSLNLASSATFIANTSATSPSYIWQSDLGQGFQTLNNIGKYSGTSTNTMSISNVQLSNHMEPIRAISVSGNCRDTSNIAYLKITDTCITKINDTIKITKYDTIITKITKYDTIKVMDTLVINAMLSGISAPNNTNRIIVYPNPAKDHITIDYGVFSKMSGYTMKITNTLGQTVFSSPINQQSSFINLSSWTGKGVYYLQIIDKQNSIIENRKIILQ